MRLRDFRLHAARCVDQNSNRHLGAALGGGDAKARATFEATVRSSVPLGREQTMQDIGRTVAWLCSEQAQNITGQVVAIDGGITLGGRLDRRE